MFILKNQPPLLFSNFLFGIFFAIGENINSVLEQVKMKQGMEVFIFDFTTEEQISEMEKQIKVFLNCLITCKIFFLLPPAVLPVIFIMASLEIP